MMKPPRMIIEYRGPSDVVGGPGIIAFFCFLIGAQQ